LNQAQEDVMAKTVKGDKPILEQMANLKAVL
jgi:hypothetical protein